MDTENLKLFYEINKENLKLNLICTCEEGKNYTNFEINTSLISLKISSTASPLLADVF